MANISILVTYSVGPNGMKNSKSFELFLIASNHLQPILCCRLLSIHSPLRPIRGNRQARVAYVLDNVSYTRIQQNHTSKIVAQATS